MGALKNVLAAILVLSILTFIALFGQLPALRKTPIGWLQRALCLHLPNGLEYIDKRATGGRLTTRSQRLGQYLFYEQNPVVLVRDVIDVVCWRVARLSTSPDHLCRSPDFQHCPLRLERLCSAPNHPPPPAPPPNLPAVLLHLPHRHTQGSLY